MAYQAPRYYLRRLYNKFKTIIEHTKYYPVIYNANGVNESSFSKRALFIYIVKPFLLKDSSPKILTHQNARQCKQIASLLNEYEYIVDVVDVRNRKFRPSKDYDLVIRNKVFDSPPESDAIKIYLATTMQHRIHNENLRRRHELLYERRGCRVKTRRIYPEAMPYVEKSDAIIGFGNEFIMNTWREAFKAPAYPFNNFGFRETEFLIDTKDFSMARRNFLFFASKSQMQKGLDLLLEIFPKHPHLHLYICSEFEKEEDFCACYYNELYRTPNIHPVGWVTVNSPKYNNLINKCAYVIHPSCSEGQPGSVVQCMYSGLIPLVTKEAGIDTEDFGIAFEDDSLEEIERVILDVSELPESWHRKRRQRTREVCEERYSEDAFMERWRSILGEILDSQDVNDDYKVKRSD